MNHPDPAQSTRLSLPLLEERDDRAQHEWAGWSADLPSSLSGALAPPEPVFPQGDYAVEPANSAGPLASATSLPKVVELLAPAGGPDAAYAAFQYGADAVYLGLKKFSARAEAENFTLEEVDAVTAYAHQLQPSRRVFVTINTLIRQDELAELLECVTALARIGVDALIIQDWGVHELVHRHFPNLELHASTQLAVHDRAGALSLARLGFKRVVLARELTLEEVRDITGQSEIETEVFVHGALCYAYSGLCLFSSQTLGRSGNRGKCAYSCRDAFQVEGAPATLRDGAAVKRDPTTGFPFSMKDLSLPDHVPALRDAGVSCLKIEGRKKSPLYVATTTDYYRRILDDRMVESERPQIEADLQTVFSRPWTKLFLDSHKDKEVADRDTVGHRGARIGSLAGVQGATRDARIRFRSDRAIQRHDGLQIDLPSLGKPFGFPVDRLWLKEQRADRWREVVEAPAGSLVEVGLPADHPHLPVGAPIYCSSSQSVKQRFRHDRPKPGAFVSLREVDFVVRLGENELDASAVLVDSTFGESPVKASVSAAGPFPPAKDSTALEGMIQRAFSRLGGTHFALRNCTVHNPANRFAPVSRLNEIRRELVEALANVEEKRRASQHRKLLGAILPPAPTMRNSTGEFAWSIKVDRLSFLDALSAEDLGGLTEIVVDIARDSAGTILERCRDVAAVVGPERIRLALPPLTRKWEEPGIRQKIESLRSAGWRRWEASNISAWSYLGIDPRAPDGAIDLATDWPMYVVNRLAAEALLKMGAGRFALSPEDGIANAGSLLVEFPDRAVVIVHQDTPLFLAESCAYANLIGGCPGKANCKFESMEMISSHGERVTALDYHCRTIVLNDGAFCLSTRLPDLARAGARNLRADFVYRSYQPDQVRDRLRAIRLGKPIAGGHAANFDRGMQ